MRWSFSKKGQTTLEYAVLISAVVMALAFGREYIKTKLEAMYRAAGDRIEAEAMKIAPPAE